MLRAAAGAEILHVDGSVDPMRDIDTIDSELILADLQSVERCPRPNGRPEQDPAAIARRDVLAKIAPFLEEGKPARVALESITHPDQRRPCGASG